MQHEICTYDSFVPTLLAEVPGFQVIYDEHLQAYDEVLPHVLVGDLTRYVVASYRQMRTDASGTARQVADRSLALLEQAMQSSDARLQELVSVSFLENLHQADEDYDDIKTLLGPHLVKELAHYESA